MPSDHVPDDADSLYALPPEEFTAARDALVKQLRADKRPAEAAAVKQLRRPTRPAWAVNQVARTRPDVVDALIDAGAQLAAAQRRALSRVKDAGLREAMQQRRDRLDEAWSAAASVLEDAGVDPAAHRAPVTATFEAASVDDEAAAAVRTGRLSADLPAPSGFGAIAGLAVVDSAAEAAEPRRDSAEDDAAVNAARDAARAAVERADELQQRAGDARQRAVRTRAEAQRLQERADGVRQRADEAEAEAEELSQRAEAARVEADTAQAALRRAADAVGG